MLARLMKNMTDYSSTSDSENDETHTPVECTKVKASPTASEETGKTLVLEAKALKRAKASKSKPKRQKKSTSSSSSIASSSSSTSAAATSTCSETTVAAVDPTASLPAMSSSTVSATAAAIEASAPSADLIVLDEFNFDSHNESPLTGECECSLCSLSLEMLCYVDDITIVIH